MVAHRRTASSTKAASAAGSPQPCSAGGWRSAKEKEREERRALGKPVSPQRLMIRALAVPAGGMCYTLGGVTGGGGGTPLLGLASHATAARPAPPFQDQPPTWLGQSSATADSAVSFVRRRDAPGIIPREERYHVMCVPQQVALARSPLPPESARYVHRISS